VKRFGPVGGLQRRTQKTIRGALIYRFLPSKVCLLKRDHFHLRSYRANWRAGSRIETENRSAKSSMLAISWPAWAVKA